MLILILQCSVSAHNSYLRKQYFYDHPEECIEFHQSYVHQNPATRNSWIRIRWKRTKFTNSFTKLPNNYICEQLDMLRNNGFYIRRIANIIIISTYHRILWCSTSAKWIYFSQLWWLFLLIWNQVIHRTAQ
jgi:hypothetical protein